jgi:hypothetical protein
LEALEDAVCSENPRRVGSARCAARIARSTFLAAGFSLLAPVFPVAFGRGLPKILVAFKETAESSADGATHVAAPF